MITEEVNETYEMFPKPIEETDSELAINLKWYYNLTHTSRTRLGGIKTVTGVKTPERNEPCPCGSKKANGNPIKFKNCCGKAR